jgi:hypothetical protein
MPNKLTITFLAGALALAGPPAFAGDLPDSGSKNFDPPGDTPSYFSNETAPVSARTADTTERDWSAVDALAPDRPAARAAPSAHQGGGKHGRSGRYGAGQSTRFAKASAGAGTSTASVHYASAQSKTASKKPGWAASAKSTPKDATPSAAKTTSGKHWRTGARHARAAIPALPFTV